ncbi:MULTISPECIES: RnfH family protein [unclassified Xanthomonas]|uniref:RnfH family protein n=1 Tax=unclassified Xanthomonas TaxID=2643310 RepID=UPI001612F475|nr:MULTISPECIES: RnfH family protein [unclassified Xanthomonas]MBB4129492.1 hypothetical protein [Xanthomonas sp. 3075]MBB5862565.1 hypothetical protein [Xanthomonas sp. 3058]
MRVEVVLAWPDRYSSVSLDLADGTTVAEAIAASGLALEQPPVAQAVHGLIARPDQVLRDGDRVELLRPLLLDPKEARRRRAGPGKKSRS